jgi:hypothetical protein
MNKLIVSKKVANATLFGATPVIATTEQLICFANFVALVAGCGDFFFENSTRCFFTASN